MSDKITLITVSIIYIGEAMSVGSLVILGLSRFLDRWSSQGAALGTVMLPEFSSDSQSEHCFVTKHRLYMYLAKWFNTLIFFGLSAYITICCRWCVKILFFRRFTILRMLFAAYCELRHFFSPKLCAMEHEQMRSILLCLYREPQPQNIFQDPDTKTPTLKRP